VSPRRPPRRETRATDRARPETLALYPRRHLFLSRERERSGINVSWASPSLSREVTPGAVKTLERLSRGRPSECGLRLATVQSRVRDARPRRSEQRHLRPQLAVRPLVVVGSTVRRRRSGRRPPARALGATPFRAARRSSRALARHAEPAAHLPANGGGARGGFGFGELEGHLVRHACGAQIDAVGRQSHITLPSQRHRNPQVEVQLPAQRHCSDFAADIAAPSQRHRSDIKAAAAAAAALVGPIRTPRAVEVGHSERGAAGGAAVGDRHAAKQVARRGGHRGAEQCRVCGGATRCIVSSG
jgi:hypothetical protein